MTACLNGPHDADQYWVSGIDISHHQGSVDWAGIKRAEHDFIFLKATEGRNLRDKNFQQNWAHAARLNLRRGAYHYFRPNVPVGEQARLFYSTVNLLPGDLPPVLDIEELGALTTRQLVKAVRELAALLELRYEVRPIIYTGQNFYNRHLAGQIDEYPLWLARYDREQPVTVCGRGYQFWQYTSRGRSLGIDGRVDENVFIGTRRELASLCIPHNKVGAGAPVSYGRK